MATLKYRDPVDGIFKLVQVGAVGGATGAQGPIGPTGPTGVGIQGPRGLSGPTGPTGGAVVVNGDYVIAKRTTDATWALGTVTTDIPMDIEATFLGTGVRLNTGWLKIAEAGVYQFGGTAVVTGLVNSNSIRIEIAILRNGTTLTTYPLGNTTYSGSTHSASGSSIYTLQVNDELRLRVTSTTDPALGTPRVPAFNSQIWAIQGGAITGATGPTGPAITGPTGPTGPAGSGSGTAYTRTSSTINTSTITAGANLTTTVTLAAGYRLLNISSNKQARIRMYTTAAKQTADLSRSITTPPTGDHGLAFEFIATPTLLSSDIVPAVDGYGRNTPYDIIPVTITNTDTTNQAISVTITWIRTE
jgi:hypothetical protein